MIDRLSEQLRNKTSGHSHSYVVLSLLAVIVFAGWFIYHGITNSTQAQAAATTGSYSSPIISLNLSDEEFVTGIEGAIITETVPLSATTNYKFYFYDESGSAIISDIGRSQLSGLTIDTLSPVKAFSFVVELSATVETELPVVDSVELSYTTETTTPEPEPGEPTDQHIPNLSITFLAKVDHGFGKADPALPFYFYFFKENTSSPTFTSAPAVTYSSSADQYLGGPIAIDSSKLEAAIYKAYVKTSKHLSSQPRDVEVVLKDGVGPTTAPVEINFGTLRAGDIGGNSLPYGELANRDDSVTSSDWAIFEGLFGEISDVVTTLLGDFNNDGSVNVHDLWPFRSQSDGGNYQLGGGL
ncbi:hypothetical protein DRH29_02325 [candidate division Kazan bacterium]|uniref:Dockerin domain-containing protein n=1 Tax=candidate division Kazan bacterium TaxID=2202143 RepID=A0A420ZCT7_UNCK3|nr:MAG: hypothetical protein DRH29_02325 [candidate division Kazan bacterium]